MAEEVEHMVKVAVLEEQMRGLREQQRMHAESTRKSLSDLAEKVDKLFEVMNRGRGAFAVSVALAGVIGAAMIKIIAYILGK
ncbi:MAG: hypothetical protein EB060_03655 [Proteobacteria bacterium]|nr:hypothetical protein [Pseudomonadota bacterium]